MDNVSTITTTNGDDRKPAVAWLRGVLTSTLEISPLSYWQKKKTIRLLKRMPDWLIASCAESLNVDYLRGFKQYPDLAEKAKSDTGRSLAQQYLEANDAVPMANIVDDLICDVVKEATKCGLPADGDVIKKHVCALAYAACTAEGSDFAHSAKDIMGDPESPNHPIVGYHLALANRDRPKIKALDATLAGGRYGSWVAERLTENKRWLSGGAELNIRWEIGTLPDDAAIYQFLLKGGKRNES